MIHALRRLHIYVLLLFRCSCVYVSLQNVIQYQILEYISLLHSLSLALCCAYKLLRKPFSQGNMTSPICYSVHLLVLQHNRIITLIQTARICASRITTHKKNFSPYRILLSDVLGKYNPVLFSTTFINRKSLLE